MPSRHAGYAPVTSLYSEGSFVVPAFRRISAARLEAKVCQIADESAKLSDCQTDQLM